MGRKGNEKFDHFCNILFFHEKGQTRSKETKKLVKYSRNMSELEEEKNEETSKLT